MVATNVPHDLPEQQRIVITGIGLTAPNGNNLTEFRESLLAGRSGVRPYEIRYVGKTLAGVCDFERPPSTNRGRTSGVARGPGSVGIYCAGEAVHDAGLDWPNVDLARVGVLRGRDGARQRRDGKRDFRTQGVRLRYQFWSHHHNPRTVANNPAGEVSLNLGITGPHYTVLRRPARLGTPASSRACRCSGLASATSPWPAAFRRAFTHLASL